MPERVPALAFTLAVVTALASSCVAEVSARTLNGFALESSIIDVDEIRHGGPRRDGIPALVDPMAVAADAASWPDDAMMIGLEIGGEARAYPIDVLIWHEIANDTLGGEPVMVTFCPLCGTGMAFHRKVAGRTRSFGVSGLLYRSDMLLYDRETGALWSQISAEAVTGESEGARLRMLRSRMLPWKEWRARHPNTSVLTTDTGHRRPYGESPYADYASSPQLIFDAPVDSRFHPKLPTLGLRLAGGPARAYPSSEVERAGGRVVERFEGREIAIVYHAESKSFEVEAPDDVEIVEGFWFAWAAFHPTTSVFTSSTTRAPAEGAPGEQRP